MRVPDFESHLHWINSPPLSFQKELKGKIVVLDFWTFCCINCLHILPEIKLLEEKYTHDPVVFIGVHSPKFTHEQADTNVRCAVQRHAINHPIVSDPTMKLWKILGVRAWPTCAVISPLGEVLALFSGEGKGSSIDTVIEDTLKKYRSILNKDPLPRLSSSVKPSPLAFPGKLAYSSHEKCLYVSDSSHHRIVKLSLEGECMGIIGSGNPGWKDGGFETSCFSYPQGLCILNNKLYVADTENHLIREIDLTHRTIRTLLGTGAQGHDYQGGKKGIEQEISSPWDVCAVGNKLFIAMAGTHQIWLYDIQEHIAKNFSGTGAELHLDTFQILKAGWAQPSGLASDGNRLFIADSESSSIRMLHFYEGGTETLAGGDPLYPQNLFSFGDKEGIGHAAKLQHPLGVLWLSHAQSLLVADSYNHRIKLLDPKTKQLTFWVGSGKAGYADGKGEESQFSEPSGLAATPDGEWIFVADTNNHLVRKIHFSTKEVSTLTSLHA